MKKYLFAALPFLGFSPAFSGGTVILSFVTHVEELQEGLDGYQEYPLAVQMGRGFFSAPVRAVKRCLTPIGERPGFYDQHTDPNHKCVNVVVLMDTSRAEVAE